jgi:hypothetical protein
MWAKRSSPKALLRFLDAFKAGGGGVVMVKTWIEVDLGRNSAVESDTGQAGGALELSLLGQS